MRSRRLALIAAVTLTGALIVGCGDAPGRTASGLPKIHLGAGNAAGRVAADSSMVAGEGMFAPYMPIDFTFNGTLPDLGTDAVAYRYAGGAVADVDRVAELAAVLGVEGDVESVPADQGGGWRVGPSDYSGPVVQVAADAMLSWWYSPGAVESKGWGCAVPDIAVEPAPDGTIVGGDAVVPNTVEPCVAPEPPAGVPTKAEAEASARDLLKELGANVDRLEFEVWADDWSAWVTAYEMIDGSRSPLAWSVGFGENGTVTSAGGMLGTLEEVGAYPIVSTAAGLERLNDESGRWTGFGGMYATDARVATMGMSVGGATGAVSATGEATAAPSSGTAVTVTPTPGAGTAVAVVGTGGGTDGVAITTGSEVSGTTPMVIATPDSLVDPMPQVVELTSVRLALTMYWDVDGSVWMLPAYEFSTADGGVWTVIAVDESYVDLPEVPDTVVPPATVDLGTVPSGSVIIDPMPEPVAQADAEAALIGLTEAEANKVAAERGWTVRVARLDGEELALTMDYQPTRVNVEITAGEVTAIVSIG